MTPFEKLCQELNVTPGSKYEALVSGLVNNLIFDEKRNYSDSEIYCIAYEQFRRLVPYLE